MEDGDHGTFFQEAESFSDLGSRNAPISHFSSRKFRGARSRPTYALLHGGRYRDRSAVRGASADTAIRVPCDVFAGDDRTSIRSVSGSESLCGEEGKVRCP